VVLRRPGVCLTGSGPAGHFEKRVIAWLKRYVANRKVGTGPGFEWLADDATWRHAPKYPPKRGAPVVGEGSPARSR
jgi:ABC-2 type transport system ATP-binding protein